MTSPSQIHQAQACYRLWAFRNIVRIPEPMSTHRFGDARSVGIAIHDIAQRYLERGEMPDRHTPQGRVFIAGLPHLPRPGTAICEGRVSMRTRDATYYGGYIDFRARDWSIIGDHKTSSDPVKYAMSPDALRKDAQAIVYARIALWRAPDLKKIRLLWVYYKTLKTRRILQDPQKPEGLHNPCIQEKHTGRPQSRAVDVTIERGEVVETFARDIHPIGRALDLLKKHRVHPLALPGNYRTCKNHFRRECPYRQHCSDATDDRVFKAEISGERYDAVEIANSIQ